MQFKRSTVRTSEKAHLEPEAAEFGLKKENVIGWFATKYNMAFGWALLRLTENEQAEFGPTAIRTYSSQTNTCNIVKINPVTGTYAFLDNEAYLEGQVKFDRMESYNRIVINDEAFFS